MIKKITYILFTILFILAIACKSSTSNIKPEESMDNENLGFEKVEELKEIFYRFPSPDELFDIVDITKIDFNDKILLPPNYVVRYLDSRSQELNLGVYIADLAYIMVFQRQKEAFIYFQIVYGLSDRLRLSSAFDISLMKRFENNLSIPDSLRKLSDMAINDITNFLVENDKEKSFTVLSIGGFIEGLYLTFNMAGEFRQDNILIQRISDQKLVLNNLINYSMQYSTDSDVAESLKILQPIGAVFNELATKEKETKVTKSSDGKLIISGGDKIVINQEQYNKLREVTFVARKKITENLEN